MERLNYKVIVYNFSNKNADEFLAKIKENDVDTLDLRELIIKENLNRNEMFYKK